MIVTIPPNEVESTKPNPNPNPNPDPDPNPGPNHHQAAQRALAEKDAVQKHMEAQVVRLSEAFNRQVEERDDLQSHLEAAEMKARQMVEKGVARSWVVNFVENRERRPEFLRLMASWWEFSEGDLLRVGLAEELPPDPGLPPDATRSPRPSRAS